MTAKGLILTVIAIGGIGYIAAALPPRCDLES